MTEIKAIIFDVGGVLVRTADPAPRRRLEQRLGLASGDAERIVLNSEMGTKAQRGAIRADALWAWVQQHFALRDDELRTFRAEFWGGDRLDEELVAYIRALRPHYQTAIISNAMDDLHETLTQRHAIADAFDLIVGSAYEGIMKPDAAIFRRTLNRLGRHPQEAVFIDDFAHNVKGAQAVGLHVIHFTPGMDLPAALARLGVTPHD